MGATANTWRMSNTQIDLGRMYQRHRRYPPHATWSLIGTDFKTRFFANVDPIGKTVAIDGRPFEVVGVAKPKGSVFGQSQDSYVAIPDQTYFKIYGATKGISYNFKALEPRSAGTGPG